MVKTFLVLYLFLSIGVMNFNLLVIELVDILAVRQRSLSSISILEVVDNNSVGKHLLDIFVLEIDNSEPILKDLHMLIILCYLPPFECQLRNALLSSHSCSYSAPYRPDLQSY